VPLAQSLCWLLYVDNIVTEWDRGLRGSNCSLLFHGQSNHEWCQFQSAGAGHRTTAIWWNKQGRMGKPQNHILLIDFWDYTVILSMAQYWFLTLDISISITAQGTACETWLYACKNVTWSDKIGFIARKYVFLLNNVYLYFCVSYSSSVCFSKISINFLISDEKIE